MTYNLYAETNSFSEPTPDSCAADFINGTAALLGKPDEDARAVYDEIVKLAERHEPEGFKLARRCAAIYDDAEGDGAYYFAEHVDAVLEGGEDWLMPNPDSKYFAPLFVEAWGDFWSYFEGFKDALLSREGYTADDASAARQMLPDLLISWQKAQPKGKGKK